MEKRAECIVDLLEDQPRELWSSILKPYLIKEEEGYSYFNLDVDDHAAFKLEELNPEYKSQYNIGDVVIDKNGTRWLIYDTSIIDSRSSDEYKDTSSGVFIWMLVDNGNHIPMFSIDPTTGKILDDRYEYIDESKYTLCDTGRNEMEEKFMKEHVIPKIPVDYTVH